MPLEMLIQEAQGMSDEAIMEVVHFMQFLKIAPRVDSVGSDTSEKKIYRKPGLYKDQIVMLAGFDEPLDEFEEYM